MPPPIESPQPPQLKDGDTDPSIEVSKHYVKEKAHHEAAKAAWKAGWIAGLAGVGVAVGLSFTGWFKIEAMAAEKAAQAVKDAGAETDKKIAPLERDVAVIKEKVNTLTDDMAEIKEDQKKTAEQSRRRDEEILRLLRQK